MWARYASHVNAAGSGGGVGAWATTVGTMEFTVLAAGAAAPRPQGGTSRMKLLLARHGESVANVLGVISNRDLSHPLTEQGRRQAAGLAEWVRAYAPTRALASPVVRARETAEIVSAALGVPWQIAEALREYDCGILEGRGDEAAWAEHRALAEEWLAGHGDRRITGGESLDDIRARFVPFIEGLVREYGPTPQTLLLIGHGGLYRWALPAVLRGADAAFFEAHPFGYAGCWVAELRGDALVCVGWRE